MAGAANWTQTGHQASIALGQSTVLVQLDRPALGLSGMAGIAPTDVAQDCVLGIHLPQFADPIPDDMMIDQYVRQPDLIAVYERAGADHLRAQVDWRYDAQATLAGTVSGLHVWISLQTNRLDSRPLLRVITALRDAELVCGDSPCGAAETHVNAEDRPVDRGVLFRPAATPAQSLALFVMPQDVLRCRLSRDAAQSGWQCEHTLLGEHLEKGVIRRAQLAVYPLARLNDEAVAAELLAKFLAGPLPLTV